MLEPGSSNIGAKTLGSGGDTTEGQSHTPLRPVNLYATELHSPAYKRHRIAFMRSTATSRLRFGAGPRRVSWPPQPSGTVPLLRVGGVKGDYAPQPSLLTQLATPAQVKYCQEGDPQQAEPSPCDSGPENPIRHG